MERESIGVDVSKAILDVYSTKSGSWNQFSNDPAGIRKFLKWVKQEGVELVTLEPTGAYSRKLLRALSEAQIAFLVVNPKRMRDFARGIGKLAKTDKLDALVIATYGKKSDDAPSKLPSQEEESLRDLCARRQQLAEMIVQEQNRLKVAPKGAALSIRETIRFLQVQLKKIAVLVEAQITANDAFSKKAILLRSAVGVGPVVSAILISYLPELGTLNKRQIAALCGLAPVNCDSGTFSGKKRIMGGRTMVRSALYMATLTAVQRDETFRAKYQQLQAAGKEKKVALTACARKLIIILNAMMRSQVVWRCETTTPNPKKI